MPASTNKKQERLIDVVIASADRILSAEGFSQSDRGEWQRKSDWKIEEVDLRIRGMQGSRLQPAFRVAIPRSEITAVGDTYRYIAEAKLPQIVDPASKPTAQIVIPRFSFQADRFVKTITSDIEQSLNWFNQFRTPQLCKENLDKFIKPGCPAFLDAEKVLTHFQSSANDSTLGANEK